MGNKKRILWFLMIALFYSLFMNSFVRADEGFQAYYDKAVAASQAGKMEEAIKLYEKVLELNPNFAPAYMGLGSIYEQRTQDADAVAWYYKSALQIDPNNIDAYTSLGRVYQRANQPDLAELYFKKVLELAPDSLETQYALAWTYLFGKAKPEEAVNYFNLVLSKAKIPMAYYGLGLAYSRIGEQARVLEVITELKGMGQNDIAAKLEDAIRKPLIPEPPVVQPPPEPPPTSVGASTVRLRGKLFNVDNAEKTK